MNNILIRAQKIIKTYKLQAEEINAVKNVDLEIRSEEFIAIMGPSGSGKTTLLDILGCLDKVSSGKLEVFDKDVSLLKESSNRASASGRYRADSYAKMRTLRIQRCVN